MATHSRLHFQPPLQLDAAMFLPGDCEQNYVYPGPKEHAQEAMQSPRSKYAPTPFLAQLCQTQRPCLPLTPEVQAKRQEQLSTNPYSPPTPWVRNAIFICMKNAHCALGFISRRCHCVDLSPYSGTSAKTVSLSAVTKVSTPFSPHFVKRVVTTFS